MSGISDIGGIGYKRAVYATLIATCLTPGILYLYLEKPSLFSYLGTAKTILFGLAIAAPVLVFNMALAFLIVYGLFNTNRYRDKEKGRVTEEVLNRIVLTSSILAASMSLNLSVLYLSLWKLDVSCWVKVAALSLDFLLLMLVILLLKEKVDHDYFHHGFCG